MTFHLQSVNGRALLAFLVLFLPRGGLSGCVFGANNTQELIQRNATILREMNNTLMSQINTAILGIQGFVQSFTIWDQLSKWHNVTSGNLLEFVKNGKLLEVAWVNETADYSNPSLTKGIITQFVEPVHEALQNISVQYSFSYGIFRPKESQFHFAGLESTGALTTDCFAGSLIVFNMWQDFQYDVTLRNTNSSLFATLATLIEQQVDKHFRSATSPFTNDFVRVNVLNASLVSDQYSTKVQAELYFLNQSRTWSEVLSHFYGMKGVSYYDSRDGMRGIKFWGYELSGKGEAASNWSTRTIISTTDYTTVPTFPSTSTLLIDTSSSSIASTMTTSDTTVSTDPTTGPTTSTASTSSTLELTSSSTSLLPTFSSTFFTENSSVTSTNIAYNSSGTFGPSATTAAGTLQNSAFSTVIQSQIPSSLPSDPTSTITASTAAGSQQSTPPGTNGSNTISLYTPSVNPFSSQHISVLTNSPTNTTNLAKLNGTTFDPDPLFLPIVPVVTKVYNDDFLLRAKLGRFVPLTERAAFYAVSIPAAMVMIILIVGCFTVLAMERLKPSIVSAVK